MAENQRAYTQPDGREQAAVNQDPALPAYSKENTAGEPSLPRTTRTSIGTSLDWVNQQLSHECQTTKYVKLAMGKAQGLAREIALAIRNGLKAVLKALGINPASAGFANFIKTITRYIDRLTYWINKINRFAQDVVQTALEIKAIIDYILSLPAKLLQLFQKCLDEAIAELQRGLFQTLSELGNVADFTEIGAALVSVQTSVENLQRETLTLVNQPSAIMNALTSPSTMTDAQSEQLLLSLFPDSERYSPTSFQSTV